MSTMLPAAPKSFGRLTDVLASAHGAIGGSSKNSLGFKKAKKAVVVLVDGLGVANLKFQPGHAPFLNRALASSRTIECAFPSTTVASITSLATGLAPGKHPIVGYQVYDRALRKPLNMLTGWGADFSAPEIQSQQTISELAVSNGEFFAACGPRAYETSGFTEATMRQAKYLPAESLEDRVEETIAALKSQKTGIVYLYIPELDQIAHAEGSTSAKWLAKLEEVDHALAQLASRVSADTGVVVTADHGIIDVPHGNHIFLDQHLEAGVDFVGGDPRVNFVYLSDGATANVTAVVSDLRAQLGDRCFVSTRDELINQGWYGSHVSKEAFAYLPDVFVIARATVAIYDRRFAKPKSMKMIGQHGGFTAQETKIPLITLGAFS